MNELLSQWTQIQQLSLSTLQDAISASLGFQASRSKSSASGALIDQLAPPTSPGLVALSVAFPAPSPPEDSAIRLEKAVSQLLLILERFAKLLQQCYALRDSAVSSSFSDSTLGPQCLRLCAVVERLESEYDLKETIVNAIAEQKSVDERELISYQTTWKNEPFLDEQALNRSPSALSASPP